MFAVGKTDTDEGRAISFMYDRLEFARGTIVSGVPLVIDGPQQQVYRDGVSLDEHGVAAIASTLGYRTGQGLLFAYRHKRLSGVLLTWAGLAVTRE